MMAQQSTMVYPPGCKEVAEDLRVDELIRRLKVLSSTFQGMCQKNEDADYYEYIPLCLHLAEDVFLSHESKDVRLLIACCLADVLRMYAPDAPYSDPEQMKIILTFLVDQLHGLKNVKDAAFKRYFYLFENLVTVKSFNICLDLEDAEERICKMFKMLFRIVQSDHSVKLKSLMLDVMHELIQGLEQIPPDRIMEIILENILEKSANAGAYKLAKDLIIKSSNNLEFSLQNYFNKILIYEPDEKESRPQQRLHAKVFDVIYELHDICPSLMAPIIPLLEWKLKSSEKNERLGAVSLLGKMFSAQHSFLASQQENLWKAFLGRFNDVSPAVRIKCVQYSMHFLLNHEDLRKDIVDTLGLRQHDGEEAVRLEVVKAIVATAKLNFAVVSESENLLNYVKDRTLDKKFKIRKEALQGLGLIYKKHLTMETVPFATREAVCWIKDKILHGYYLSSLEDKTLIERLLNSCLVPFQMSSKERMKKLLYLYVTLDENAAKAFVEIQKNLYLVRRSILEFLKCIDCHKDSEDYNKYLSVRISQLTKLFPDHVKTSEFLTKFAGHLSTDADSFKKMEMIVSPDIECESCAKYINLILKKLGPPIMTNLYHTTIKLVLERAASVLVDGEAITNLLMLLFEMINGKQDVLDDIGCFNEQQGISRGLALISVLASVFPAHFSNDKSLRLLIEMLHVTDDELQPQILSALTSTGSCRPISNFGDNLMHVLIGNCEEMLTSGTPVQAKRAVRCLHVNITDLEVRKEIFAGFLTDLKVNLNPENSSYKTAIVALGHIALLMPEEFKSDLKTIIARQIVKELLVHPRRTQMDKEKNVRDWCEKEDLPEVTQCMIAGMKTIVRWLIGLQEDPRAAVNTFNMLTAFIETRGDFINAAESFSQAEKSWLRLAAGCCMLKVCEKKGVGDHFTAAQFLSLSKLMIDEVPQVRSRFAWKLHAGLARGIPHKCLPLDFMGFYALAGYEKDKKEKTSLKSYIVSDVTKRRDYIKTFMSRATEKSAEQMPHIMPDYMLAFGIAVLAHNPKFNSHEDSKQMAEVKDCLCFIMEPLILENDICTIGFYWELLKRITNHRSAINPENDDLNHRIYVICDMALELVAKKSSLLDLKDFDMEPRIPTMYFTKNCDPFYNHTRSYMPGAMKCTPQKKSPDTQERKLTKRRRKKGTESPILDADGNVSIDAQPNDASEVRLQEEIPGILKDDQEDQEGPARNLRSRKSVMWRSPVSLVKAPSQAEPSQEITSKIDSAAAEVDCSEEMEIKGSGEPARKSPRLLLKK